MRKVLTKVNGRRWQFLILTLCFAFLPVSASELPTSERLTKVRLEKTPIVRQAVEAAGFVWGTPIFIRIFKQSAELEVWLQESSGRFALYKTFPICTFSGELGPKTREGDNQAPEGFYFVNAARMNPWSRFHLSFNLGYPNAYDQWHGATGSALMVHGDCVSIGCYAMTDSGIEEIYLLAEAAMLKGQRFFRVHAFPFRMTDVNMHHHRQNRWSEFWQNLQAGYDWFEKGKTPPDVEVRRGRYVFSSSE